MTDDEPQAVAVPGVAEAPLVDDGNGMRPSGPGWFVVNVADAAGWRSSDLGEGVGFESREHRFPHVGLNVHVLRPGQASCRYHLEPAQEAFLVLRGRCLLVVEEEERELVAGDFFHCPPMTRHVIVGAGAGPCAILMVGARLPEDGGGYPASVVAARHGASVAATTPLSSKAYAGLDDGADARLDLSWIFTDC